MSVLVPSAPATAGARKRKRDWRTDVALRAQPSREGPDFWPTPASLIAACVCYVLPLLPPGLILEVAAGDGRLARAMAAAGRQVISTDLYPRDGSEPRDFLKAVPVVAGASVVTNPPNCRADAFIERGLRLLDQGAIVGIALLLRHDYLQAGSRVATFNRATHVVHCNWRAIWVDGTDGQPRWAFHWVLWTDRPQQPPLYLQLRLVIGPAPHTLPETQRKRWKENKMPVISPA